MISTEEAISSLFYVENKFLLLFSLRPINKKEGAKNNRNKSPLKINEARIFPVESSSIVYKGDVERGSQCGYECEGVFLIVDTRCYTEQSRAEFFEYGRNT